MCCLGACVGADCDRAMCAAALLSEIKANTLSNCRVKDAR